MLPKIAMSIYTLTLPGIKGEIKFRPFIVKENKLVLEANEMGDKDHLFKTIQEVIAACTFDAIDVKKLPTYLIDYLFLRIKAKSSGEIVPVTFTCPQCGNKTLVNLNITDAQIVFPEGWEESKLIMIDEEAKTGIKLKAPSFEQMAKIAKHAKDKNFFDLFTFAAIESVFDGDTVNIPGNDFSFEEFVVFLNSLQENVLIKINEFLDLAPYVAQKVTLCCPSCKHVEDMEVKNLENFFG
jgi:hypothetical protein